VQGLLAPAIATVFLLGVFWKRTTAKGAFWGMITGFAVGMFRLALNVTIGAKAGLVMEAKKLMVRVNDVTDYTRELLVNNMQVFSDKIGKMFPSGAGESMQSSVKEAAGSMSVISPDAKMHATNLLSQVSGSLDQIFTHQYGFLFKVASVNSYIFTAFLFLFCIILVIVISMFTKAPDEKQLQYTMYAATDEDKAVTRASWNKWDVIHTVIILTVVALFYIYFW